MSEDDVRSLRNYFVVGLYDNVLQEAEGSTNPAARVFYFRALLEASPEKAFKQIDDKAPTALQAIKLFGTFRTAAEEQRELVHETLNEWLNDSILGNDETLQLMAAHIYFEEGDYKEALKLVSDSGENLEKLAMQAMIFMKIDRTDLAGKAVKNMGDIDDDDALTQLVTSWYYISQGGEKLTEALFLLQELVEKFGKSEALLVSQAICYAHMSNLSEANSHLKQARALSVSENRATSADTMINFVTCLLLAKGNPAVIEKITSELASKNEGHVWLKKQEEMSALFDQHAQTYQL